MSAIINKIEDNFLFGCIQYKNKTEVYLMPVAYWILNYEMYDPDLILTSGNSLPAALKLG
jgi:hypothetical protein